MKTIFKIIIPLVIVIISCSNPQETNKTESLIINTENDTSILDGQSQTANEVYDCDELPSTFSSYEEALVKIFNANFRYSDNITITNSSWIRSASYYSCDGNLGFFIIKTDKQYYIHKDLPISVWKSFKSSTSFGTYYSHYIKSEYQFLIN